MRPLRIRYDRLLQLVVSLQVRGALLRQMPVELERAAASMSLEAFLAVEDDIVDHLAFSVARPVHLGGQIVLQVVPLRH